MIFVTMICECYEAKHVYGRKGSIKQTYVNYRTCILRDNMWAKIYIYIMFRKEQHIFPLPMSIPQLHATDPSIKASHTSTTHLKLLQKQQSLIITIHYVPHNTLHITHTTKNITKNTPRNTPHIAHASHNTPHNTLHLTHHTARSM